MKKHANRKLLYHLRDKIRDKIFKKLCFRIQHRKVSKGKKTAYFQGFSLLLPKKYAVFNSGDGGSRTHAPLRTYRISSATSYDHLSTSPLQFFIISVIKEKVKFFFIIDETFGFQYDDGITE